MRKKEKEKNKNAVGSPREHPWLPYGCGSSFFVVLLSLGGKECWVRGCARTSSRGRYMPELERSTPAKTGCMIETEVVRIPHAACNCAASGKSSEK